MAQIVIDGEPYRIDIVDTSGLCMASYHDCTCALMTATGNAEFADLIRAHLLNVDGVVLVYAIDDIEVR